MLSRLEDAQLSSTAKWQELSPRTYWQTAAAGKYTGRQHHKRRRHGSITSGGGIMSRIATCSNCHGRVTVPKGLEESQPVRCPLCQAEYPSSEVLAEVSAADDDLELPPQLVLVPPNADGSAADTEGPGETEGSSEEPHAPEVETAALAQEDGEPPERAEKRDDESGEAVEQALERAGDSGQAAPEAAEPADATAEPTGGTDEGEGEADTPEAETSEPERETGETKAEAGEPEGETVEPEGETGQPEGERDETEEQPPEPAPQDEVVRVRCPHCDAEYPLSDVVVVTSGTELGPTVAAAVARYVLAGEGAAGEAPALDVWAKADGMPQIDLGDRAKSPAVTVAPGEFDFAKEDADGEGGPASHAAARPGRRRQKSVARELAAWVFGGLAGVVITAYLLAIIRGESGNILKVPLPGVPHTYKYSPRWFPGWLKPAPGSEEAGSEEAGSEEAGSEEAGSEEIADLDELYRPAQRGNEEVEGPPVLQEKRESADESPAEGSSTDSLGVPVSSPKKRTFPDGYVGLAEPPAYGSDALDEALSATLESVEDPRGPISDDVYREWCRLAEVLTFVQGGPAAKVLRDRMSAVRALLGQMAENEANLDKIGYRAGALCLDGSRPSNGILLAGKVTRIVSQGYAHQAHVQLAATGGTVLVAGKQPLPAQEEDAVLILGSIVDDPADNLSGFQTQQPFVIWAGLTVKVKE
jgi:hypothetical protein